MNEKGKKCKMPIIKITKKFNTLSGVPSIEKSTGWHRNE